MKLFITLLLGLLLSSCTSLQFESPKLSVVSVGMISADVFSQQFRIRLHVRNPNKIDLPIKGIEYTLSLQGDRFAAGATEQSFVVPAMGEAEFDTLIKTDFMSSIGRLLSKLNSSDQGKIQYAFEGSVLLSKGIVRKFPFSEQGMVELNIKK
jgi:LEA14-like dessication related protein